MKTLVINTTGKSNQIGIYDDQKEVATYTSKEDVKRGGTEILKQVAEDLLKKAKSDISEIKLIIVALGPGSYTGSRSGLSFAKAIAHSLNTPIVGISLFDVFAHILAKKDYPFQIIIPAGVERYYAKNYDSVEDLINTRETGEVLEKDDLSSNTILCTDPELKSINEYGTHYFNKKGADDFRQLLPLYLKEPNITVAKNK